MATRCDCGARIKRPDATDVCRDCLATAVLKAHGVDPVDPSADGLDRLVESVE